MSEEPFGDANLGNDKDKSQRSRSDAKSMSEEKLKMLNYQRLRSHVRQQCPVDWRGLS